MNKWKIAFFTLLILVLGSMGVMAMLVLTSERAAPQERAPLEGVDMTLSSTTKEVEAAAQTFIDHALKEQVPMQIKVDKDVQLSTEIETWFGNIPVDMTFIPSIVSNQIVLKQETLQAGDLSVSPRMALAVVDQFLETPQWLGIYPLDGQIIIDLAQAPIDNKFNIQPRDITLTEEDVKIDITIPKGAY